MKEDRFKMTEATRWALDTMASMALKTAMEDLVRIGTVTPGVIVWRDTGEIERMDVPPHIAALFMSSGFAKDCWFDSIRDFVRIVKARGVCFANDAWVGLQTEKGNQNLEEIARLIHAQQADQLYDRGYMVRAEAIAVTAQSQDAVILITQRYVRANGGGIRFTERDRQEIPQAQLGGRQKMYRVEDAQ